MDRRIFRRGELTHVLIGAAVGVGIALSLPGRQPEPDAAALPSKRFPHAERGAARLESELTDPAAILLAARAGRTGPGRRRFEELWDPKKPQRDLEILFGALVTADPSLFEDLCRDRTRQEQLKLLMIAMERIGEEDSAPFWKFLAESETVANLEQIELWKGTLQGGLYDPAGFAPEAAVQFVLNRGHSIYDESGDPESPWKSVLLYAVYSPTAAKLALKGWLDDMDGRNVPALPIFAWVAIEKLALNDPAGLQELKTRADPSMLALIENEEKNVLLNERLNHGDSLRASDLDELGESRVAQIFATDAQSGRPIRFDLLAGLPATHQKTAAEALLRNLYQANRRKDLDELFVHVDKLDLPQWQRDSFFRTAGGYEWSSFGNAERALAWIGSGSLHTFAAEQRTEILTSWAAVDPNAASKYAETIPDGEWRNFVVNHLEGTNQ